jgi:F-type H+-transporting ATPase subunit gamma
MPSLKEYNVKLTRLRSTRKLTRTMKLVSVNKLRRAQEAEKRTAACSARMMGIVARLAAATPEFSHTLLAPHRTVRSALVIVFTSDRGLCGGFNHGLLRFAQAWMAERQAAGHHVEVSCCGRRGHAFFRSRGAVNRFYEDAAGRPEFVQALQIGREAQAAFAGGRIDEVYLAYNVAPNALTQTPTLQRLLPLEPAELTGAVAASAQTDWIFEPGPADLLASLLPRLIHLKIYAALQSSATGEHSARMRAMDQATTNADNLIESLTLQRNRARQAQITTELTEIVAGAEALK